MSNAKNTQAYIDALRAGEYFTAKDLVSYVQQKYTVIAKQSLGQDEILPLLIYELCQTDINKKDVDILRFLVEHLYNMDLANGLIGYSYMTFMSAFPFAVEIKQDNSFKLINDEVDIEDFQDIKEFVSGESKFSKLSDKISELQESNLVGLMKKQVTEQDLSEQIGEMGTETFQKNIKRMYEKKSQEEIKNQLIHYVNDYKDLLINKLAQQGVHFSKDTGQEHFLRGKTKKINDLLIRYHAINNLDIENIDITHETQIQTVNQAVELCKSHRPAWIERDLLDKITDFLSFGIKPLIRALTSKQTKLEKEIEETIMSIPKFGPRS